MTWRIGVMTTKPAVPHFLEALESLTESISCFEYEGGPSWRIEGFFEEKPAQEDLISRLSLAAKVSEIDCPTPIIEALPEENWLEKSYQAFPPLRIGRFYIYGTHIADPPPADLVGITINAATAFGSGEHPTTAGCLKALEKLEADNIIFKNPMDLGCGSGILALAMRHLWDARIMTVDNDPEAVRVTKENAHLNGCPDKMRVILSQGFANPELSEAGPYDLIVSNILALPLCDMAEDIKKNTSKGAHLILSGILTDHADKVVKAYKKANFQPFAHDTIEEWSILSFKKG